MNRRKFVALIGGALAASLVASLVGAQQPEKVYRIGLPWIAPRKAAVHVVGAFEDGLRDHGYLPGKNIVIDYRSTEGSVDRLPDVVREMVRSNPDVILTGTNTLTMVVKAATQSIPIVMVTGTDVIRQGLVKSLASPGGNITGLTWDVGDDLVIKNFELLREAAPTSTRVAVLYDPPKQYENSDAIKRGLSALRLSIFPKPFSGDLKQDFADMVQQGCSALIVSAGIPLYLRSAEIVALAAKHRLPAMYSSAEAVNMGGLMSYAPKALAAYRTAARFVDRILKGAKPADIPVEQPTVLELVINLKTAKALGLTIPPTLLMRTDRVIE
jgi:putative tryptophan/tyrosine transport system substrate-binding protein